MSEKKEISQEIDTCNTINKIAHTNVIKHLITKIHNMKKTFISE